MEYKEKLIHEILKQYSITLKSINTLIDSSHGEEDLRIHVIINNEYVLKINTAHIISETFLRGINQLVKKYKSIDVWCPTIIENKNGNVLTSIIYESKKYLCYIEEKAPYSFYKEKDIYTFKKYMLPHVGKLAHQYSNQDLVKHYSMWSIIDLPSMCNGIDEKQENLNELLDVLKNNGFIELSSELSRMNLLVREKIKEKYALLPRCVYQGDLNTSNILINDKNEFVGLIDFNMYGTEVNINNFINESMYYLQLEDFELSIFEIYEKAEKIFIDLCGSILKEYALNELEKQLFPYYKFITIISFYPNVQLWIKLLNENTHVHKVLELLKLYLANVTI